ncbi:DUF3300 domain-containing protein [Herbaspirillum huttiense]|uniref:DUF3300 domain-containing protein n=1 Tax=Herbaspirillum huttiense TaxID=863372 RepID=UPI0039B0845A
MTTRSRSSALIVSASLLGAVLALSACQKQDATPPTAAAAPAAPVTPPYTPPTADQLSQMVAPIALFPDKLVAQVLAGATYPDQVVAANQWLGQNGALKGDILQAAEDKEPWDVSVKSLTLFPAVLSQMAANPDWTRALGDAFVNDPNDVMNAIQALRLRAQQAGNLKSSSQLKVVSTARSSETVRVENAPEPRTVYAGAPVIPPPPQTIVIESSQPDRVYVPAYNPAVVYGPPVPVYPGYAYRPPSPVANEVVVGALSFGVGVFVGEAISHHGDWGWHDWGMHWGGGGGDRPSGDWQRPAVVYKNTTYVSHSTTVINRVTNNNVTVNNTRVVNNNVNNVSNVNNVRNVDQRNLISQTRIDNHREPVAPAAMSMPHFTTSDARPGAMPVQHAQVPQQKPELATAHAQQVQQKEVAQQQEARQHQQVAMQAQREQQEQRQLQQQQEQRAQKEQQAAHERAQAQQARQQTEQRKIGAMKQENAHPPMQAHAAAQPPREERPAQHEQKGAPHAQETHAEPRHEPAKHEADKHANDKHEGEKHEGEKHNG